MAKSKKRGSAKKGKKIISSKKGASRVKKASKSTIWTGLLAEKDVSTSNDGLFKKIFYGCFFLFLFLTILMAVNVGFNEDEKFHHTYEQLLMDFYSSWGEDEGALNVEEGKMHIYGGFFDIITGTTNRILGYNSPEQAGFHMVRHFYNGLIGCIAMLFTGLFAQRLGGWRAGIIALVFIFFSPRFLGHSMMNPRDIPFAAGYIMALYFLTIVLSQLPKPSWKTLLGLAGGIGLAIAARAGGFLLVAYVVMFVGLDFLMRYGLKGFVQNTKELGNYVFFPLLGIFGGILFALLFWPFGLVDPINNVQTALTTFTNYSTNIRMLFSSTMPWAHSIPHISYIGKWFLYTIPLFSFIGLILTVVFIPKFLKQYPFWPIAIGFFTLLFPLGYIIYKESTLYDGWRHLLFTYTPFVALAALGWNHLFNLWQGNKLRTYLLIAIMALLILEPAIFIARNSAYCYVYFNPIAGGVSGTFGEFEQDYWGISVKKAVEWMEDEGILGEDMQDSITISSNFMYVLNNYTSPYKDKLKRRYTRFRERYKVDWDYAIYVARFVDGAHLRSGKWPSSRAIHTIKANGVPLAAIYKGEGKEPFEGYKAIKEGDWNTAIQKLTIEAQNYPDNEQAWFGLGNAYLNSNQLEKAKESLEKGLEINPESITALHLLGMYYVRTNDAANARTIFQKAVDLNSRNSFAYYYLAVIDKSQNNLSIALENAKKAIEYNPRFKQAYELAAQIFEQQGDSNSAQRYRAAMNKI